MDGQQQRKALTAAERAIQLLARHDAAGARRAASLAASLDQVGAFSRFEQAVHAAADDLDLSGVVSPAAWQAVREAVGPGPLQAALDHARG